MRIVMNLWRSIGTGVALVLVAASFHRTGAGVAPEPLGGVAGPAAAGQPAFQGAGSCSATACHGSMKPAARDAYPSRVLRNEHTTWITQDRHADAYRVLFSPRSQAMAGRLSGGASGAHEDARCLACHATGGTAPPAAATLVVRQDGVSCESCHGAAERWLGPHTQLGWDGLTAEAKQQQYGMRPTKALRHRAAVCVDCHVGSPGRDVNHDLIAAGHPRLTFEFAAFLANMPPHWVEDNGGNFPAQAWAVGQATTARAAADLLAHRARNASTAAWPEFSEYDCFACHHDLTDETWRQARGPGRGTSGTPAWGTWCYPAALWLARAGADGRGGGAGFDAPFAAVRAEMAALGSDPTKVADAAGTLSAALGAWLRELPDEARRYDTPKLTALVQTARAADPAAVSPGWDGAAQRYLALQPLRLALKGVDPNWTEPALDGELVRLFELLQFPRGYDSPRRYDPAHPPGGR
jgi:hypothetical protein